MPAAKPTTTFTWSINTLSANLADGYVYTAHYTVNANDGTYSSGAYGSVGLERPDDLIPFDDLTKKRSLAGSSKSLAARKNRNRSCLAKQIDEQSRPV
jgi:hypothetical protein